MKIGYVIACFPSLSETFVSREIAALIDSGMDIEIYSFERPPSGQLGLLSAEAVKLMQRTQYISKLEAALALIDPGMLRIRSANRTLSRAASIKTHSLLRLGRAGAIARRARENGVTALHAHWPYATQIVHLASAMTRLPYSISVHAHEVVHDGGHFPVVFPKLSFAAFCNRGAMNRLSDRLTPVQRKRAHLVYHGVDLHTFAPIAWPDKAQPLHILSAGRLTPTKGFERLIGACDAARRGGIDIRLTILGAGALHAALRRVAEQIGFSSCLDMPGWVEHSEVRRYMARAHLFALLADTGFHDGLPNVALEAMACARPVVLSPLPAACEAVTDGIEGFVLRSADDFAGFVAALNRSVAHPDLLPRMGIAARRRMELEHDAQGQIVRMAALFRRHAA